MANLAETGATDRAKKVRQVMKSPVVKRSIVIASHKTSVSLEDAFWRALKEIAIGRDKTLSDLVAEIDTGRPHGNLSSAIRLFVLDHYRAQSNGHAAESGSQMPLTVMPAAATSVLRSQ
jgi:predicted DNA-binding ribbon-helix-helix protein